MSEKKYFWPKDQEDKARQFNQIWSKGGKSKETLLQKVAIRGLDVDEKTCYEYYMGWIKPQVVTKWGKVEWANPHWEARRNYVRRGKKRSKRYNKKKN